MEQNIRSPAASTPHSSVPKNILFFWPLESGHKQWQQSTLIPAAIGFTSQNASLGQAVSRTIHLYPRSLSSLQRGLSPANQTPIEPSEDTLNAAIQSNTSHLVASLKRAATETHETVSHSPPSKKPSFRGNCFLTLSFHPPNRKTTYRRIMFTRFSDLKSSSQRKINTLQTDLGIK